MAPEDIKGMKIRPAQAEQLAQWKKAVDPLEKAWADNVRKTGVDRAVAMKELKDELAKYDASY